MHGRSRLEPFRSELPELETMQSVLTLLIESIEDFGVILLGVKQPDDYDNHVIGERELVLIEEVREQCDLQTFEQTDYLQDALIRCLEVIGEATKRPEPGLPQSTSEVPWRALAGMRDLLFMPTTVWT